MNRGWAKPAILVGLGVALSVTEQLSGRTVSAVVLLLLFVVTAVVVSPGVFPRPLTDAQARASSAQDGRPIVYWRPGCPYCLRLRASLGGDASRLHWVDIWSDPEAAATVRSIADGNETVPTVVAGSQSLVNPSPSVVKRLLSPYAS